MIATIGRMTTVTSATFSRHIARAKDERKIQSCGVRIAVGSIQAVKADGKSVLIIMDWYMQTTTISVHTEKGESRANEQQGIYRRTGERR